MQAAPHLQTAAQRQGLNMLRFLAQQPSRAAALRSVRAFATVPGKAGDGLDNWLEDHQELKHQWSLYRQAHHRHAREDQKNIVRRIIRFTTQHQSAEDRTLYPMFGKVIPEEEGGKTLHAHAHLVDETGRLMMQWLEEHDEPSNDVEWRLFEETTSHLISMTEDHIKDEEQVGAKWLRKKLARADLDRLGHDYEAAMANAPTHPHPRSPTSPLASKVTHPVTGVVDRVTDKLKEVLTGHEQPEGAPVRDYKADDNPDERPEGSKRGAGSQHAKKHDTDDNPVAGDRRSGPVASFGGDPSDTPKRDDQRMFVRGTEPGTRGSRDDRG